MALQSKSGLQGPTIPILQRWRENSEQTNLGLRELQPIHGGLYLYLALSKYEIVN